MNMRSFPEHLYDSFTRVHGWSFGTLSILLGLLTYFVSPNTHVALGWFVFLATVAMALFAIFLDAAHAGWKSSRRGLPEVRKALPPPANYPGIVRILLVEHSDIFGVDALISVYLKEDEYERLIGIGRVITVQSNGLLQIGVSSIMEVDPSTERKLDGNDASLLKKLIIKPSIPSYLLQEIP
jgi:multisubunit Na+/H+ antiporter MnhG subunit